jgi:WD40 repeat protein
MKFHSLLFVLLSTSYAAAQEAPSYAKQIRPFFARYCVECHPAVDPDGGLSLDSYKGLMTGGDHGAVFVPGKPDQSRIVRMVEGKTGPRMPPKKAKQPKKEEIALLRAWIADGARDDSGKIGVVLPAILPRRKLAAPVAALAYSPDGKTLAAGGQHQVLLLDAANGDVRARLLGQQGKVTALAFNGSGQLLAVGSGSEIRLYQPDKDGWTPAPIPLLTGHTDVIYALAFSPDGKTLASCGYDRLIKLWEVATGKLLRDLKDHSDAVYGLAFAPDGKLLASAAADRAVKVWDVASGTRLYTLGEATDWVYAVAWSPDGKHVAAGGVDKSIRIWEVDRAGGRVVHSVFAHEGPVTRLVYSKDGGTLYSLSEDRRCKAWDAGRLVERRVYDAQPETPLSLAVRPDQIAIGRYDGVLVLLDAKTGKVLSQPLPVEMEVEPNDSPRTGQKITLPASISGKLDRAGDVDFYRFEATAGQQVGVQALTAAVGSKLEPLLRLVDPDGQVVAESSNGVLGHTCSKAGWYALGIRDRDYRGGAGMHYRLRVGDVPVVTAVFPLGVQRGKEAEIAIEGVHLGGVKRVRVKAPANAAPGTRLPLVLTTPLGSPLGNPSVVVGEFADVLPAEDKPALLPVEGTANGHILKAGATDTWRFTAKKGERLLLEVEARRLGSPLDSFLEILDARGKPVPWVTLRAVARTYSTFRDHDSFGAGIRIETWGELAINDYLSVGGELIRIRELPKNPDDDCQFFSAGGRRKGYFGTTPGQISLGTPMYKVTLHPPGTTFPPSGFPQVTLYYRNDDGGAAYGKDSFLAFDPPADGDYQVRVGDARGQGGSQYAYRLTLRRPRPDFTVSFTPTAPAVWQGGAVPVSVRVERRDGFEGEIALKLENLPAGFSAPPTSIPAGENSTSFSLFAEAGAKAPAKGSPLKLVASASIGGKEVVRQATGGLPRTVPAGDLVTTTAKSAVTVRPGGQVRLEVRIERRNGFKGRVPLEVRGLPHGVRVLDVGLNGILITPNETTRTIVIYCELWVRATTHPFVVLARREGKNSEHAARSVLLEVAR